MSETKWKLLTCLSDVPSARVLTDVLAGEGIATRVVNDAAVMGQAAPCRIFVDAAQARRARRLLSQEQLTEPELIFLATGELTGEEDPDSP
jgi:Putative prokaryotic signal transducing protein